MARFILNGEIQPLFTGESETLNAEVSGIVSAGCAGVVRCIDPPCTSQPLPTKANLNGGVIAAIVFLVCLVVSVVGGFFILKRFRNNKMSRSQSGMSGTTGITGMEPTVRTKMNNLAVISDTVRMGSTIRSVKDSGFGDQQSIDYMLRNGRRSNESLLDSQVSLSSALERDLNGNTSTATRPVPTPRSTVHLGSHAYQNVTLDTTFDETSERYDLDNASSIAPSDVEVSHHYRHFRSESGSRLATNPQLIKLKNSLSGNNSSTPIPHGSYRHSHSSIATNGTYRQSPSVVKLKSALRESPASHLSVGSSGGEPRRSRPGSTHSNRSRRKTPTTEGSSPKRQSSTKSSRSGSRRSTGNNSTLRSRSFGRRHSGDDSSSSSSSGPTTRPIPPSRRSIGKSGVARSPHAPPLRDSSTESDKSDVNTGGSALDLDKVTRPRRLYYPPEATEILSDPPMLANRSTPATPNSRRLLAVPDLSVFSAAFAPQSEDETASEMGGEDVGIVPDLSHFVNRGGEFRQLISGNYGGGEKSDSSTSQTPSGRRTSPQTSALTPKLTFLHGSKSADVSLKESSPILVPKRNLNSSALPASVEQNLEAYV